MTLGLTDTSPGPAGEVTRDTTWPRRCHVSRSRVTCVIGHVMPDWVRAAARYLHQMGAGGGRAVVVTQPRYQHHHQMGR